MISFQIPINFAFSSIKLYEKTGTYFPSQFQAPLPAPTWTGSFEAVNKEISCPQTSLFISTGQQEDCLIANIFVPTTVDKLLPVIVYVHGGAYFVGNGNMAAPHPMVKQGKFIVVNFNYRLGIHGFLCLGTEDAPGNAGLKDQLALLRWVKRNIANFGGDPNDVTISGASAGASAVELLMLSETTKGLFNKVISDSGNAVSVWSIQIDPVENAKRFARLHNVTTDDIRALEEFYKTASYEQLVVTDYLHEKDSVFVFVPCIERETGIEIFLKNAPIDIIKRGTFPKVPLLIGFANMEGLFRAQNLQQWKIEMNKYFADFLPADLQFESAEEKVKVANAVKDFYFGGKEINEDTLMGYFNYFTDVLFAYPALRTMKLLVESGNTNVYLYQYSYSDNFTVSNRPFSHLDGAEHAAQFMTMAVMPPQFQRDTVITESYKEMKNQIRQLWTNFIITG